MDCHIGSIGKAGQFLFVLFSRTYKGGERILAMLLKTGPSLACLQPKRTNAHLKVPSKREQEGEKMFSTLNRTIHTKTIGAVAMSSALGAIVLLVIMLSTASGEVKFDGVDDDEWLDFGWGEPANADSAVSYYNVYLAVDAGSFSYLDSTSVSAYSVPGDSGHTYKIKVAGVNAGGDEGPHSPESDEILCIATGPDQIPPKTTDLLTAQESGGGILLTWPEVNEDSLGSPEQISHYIVYRNQVPFFTPQSSDSIAGVSSPSYLDMESGLGSSAVNSYYVITAVDLAGNESQISNRVGEFDFSIVPQTAGYYLLSPVLNSGQISTASELGQDIANCTAVKEWDPQTQSYLSRAFQIEGTWYGEWPVQPGYPYYIFTEAGPESTWTVVGTVPQDPVFSLYAPGGNGYNTITLPLSSTLILARELGQSIPNCTAVKRWDPLSQAYESIAFKVGDTWYGDTVLRRGRPYFVNVTADGTWPAGKIAVLDESSLRKQKTR
jgi:hypothetical protein